MLPIPQVSVLLSFLFQYAQYHYSNQDGTGSFEGGRGLTSFIGIDEVRKMVEEHRPDILVRIDRLFITLMIIRGYKC